PIGADAGWHAVIEILPGDTTVPGPKYAAVPDSGIDRIGIGAIHQGVRDMIIAQIGPAAATVNRFVEPAITCRIDDIRVRWVNEHARAAIAVDLRAQRPTGACVDALVDTGARIRWPPTGRILTGGSVNDRQIGARTRDCADRHREFLLHKRKPCAAAVLCLPDATIGRSGQDSIAL